MATLGLDHEDDLPIYLGDDITDEHAFEALSGRKIAIVIGDPEDPKVANQRTAADFRLGLFRDMPHRVTLDGGELTVRAEPRGRAGQSWSESATR